MKTMKRTACLCVGVALLAAKSADAQVPSPATEKFFVNVNFGGQLASRTLGATVTKTVYDEPATLTSTHPVGRGALVDFGAGYRVWGDVYVGIVVSRFSTSTDASYAASIPDPAVFNRPRSSTGSESALTRTEFAINPNVTWVTALTDKTDVAVGIGASIIKLRQEVAGDFTVPLGTQSVIPIIVEEKSTAKGVYAAMDLMYSLTAKYGVGVFVRYAGGKADLLSAPSHNVGGMQAGGGIRLRF